MKKIIPLLLLLSLPLYARPVEVTVRDYGWLTSFPAARDVLDFYLQEEENKINEDQPILDPSRVNEATVMSSVLAAKGIGTDYTLNPRKYILSASVSGAWDEERDVAIKDQISGAAIASSLAFGFRLSERMLGFLNVGALEGKKAIPGEDVDIAGEIDSTTFGFHLRYDLVESRGNWTGLMLHTGYELNRNHVEFSTTLDEPLSIDTGGQGILEGRLTGTPTFDVKTLTHSIPLELSSGYRVLSVFTFYGGLGLDLNFGESVGKGNTKGNIATLACTSGVCVGETVLPQLEVQANYDAKAEVRRLTGRAFAGLGIDLPAGLSAYAQGAQVLGTKVLSLSTGLKYDF